MIRFSPVAFLAALVCLLAPAAAMAQEAQAPPGLSAVDQYLETVPNAGGNSTPNGGRRPSSDEPAVAIATARALPSATLRALQKRGQTGRDAAALAGRSAPGGPVGSRVPLREQAAPGSLAAIGDLVTGSGSDGIGLFFPLLIVAGTIAVAGTAIRRRRSRPTT